VYLLKKVNVKVDVIGQIKLFKTATFPSKLPFIEEALQNAQRSKATLVEVWTKEDEVIITDDGIGLNDPEDLFTIAKSGWDQETIKDQNPFGLGFFSCITMADLITVESNNFRCIFDVPKMLKTNSTDIVIE